MGRSSSHIKTRENRNKKKNHNTRNIYIQIGISNPLLIGGGFCFYLNTACRLYYQRNTHL